MKEKEAQAARKDDIKKEHPNVHFAKKKSMEIYVAKDYNIAPPSAGSLNLDKEDTKKFWEFNGHELELEDCL